MKFGETKVWNVADTAGTPRTRALAAALRSSRERSGWGVRQVARSLAMSHTTISQWETGKRVPRLEDVAAMLAAIGTVGARREEILDLARGAADPNWLAQGISVTLDGLLECERTAVEIIDWSPMLVPGLFQTAEYCRVIFGADDTLLPRDIEDRVVLRKSRLDVVEGKRSGRGPAECYPIIGEWALRQRIGGPEVMRDQLEYLIGLASTKPLRVVPIREGWHPGLAGPFVLYNFAHSPSIVHAEHHRSSVFLYNEDTITAYKAAVTQIRRAALDTAESVEFIAAIMRRGE